MLSMIVNTGSSPQRKESGQQRCYVGVDFLNGSKVRHGELENLEVASLESCQLDIGPNIRSVLREDILVEVRGEGAKGVAGTARAHADVRLI